MPGGMRRLPDGNEGAARDRTHAPKRDYERLIIRRVRTAPIIGTLKSVGRKALLVAGGGGVGLLEALGFLAN